MLNVRAALTRHIKHTGYWRVGGVVRVPWMMGGAYRINCGWPRATNKRTSFQLCMHATKGTSREKQKGHVHGFGPRAAIVLKPLPKT